MVLGCNLRTGEVKIMIYHLKCRVAQDFPKRENIPSIHQVVYRKRMSAEMCMQSLHTGYLGQSATWTEILS